MRWAALAAAALLPWLALREVNETGLAWLRDRVLWGLAAVGGASACVAEPWLTPICAVVLGRWAVQGHAAVASAIAWAGIVGAWFAAAPLPPRWLAYAIMPGLCYQAALAAAQWYATRQMAVGLLAQRTFAASLFALGAPLIVLMPWWAAAGAGSTLLCGLAVTSSWLAFAALLVGLAVLWPPMLIVLAPLALAVAFTLASTLGHDPQAHRSDAGTWLARYSPRGDSLDSLYERAWTWDATLRHLFTWPTWLVGAGPRRMAYDLMDWTARYRTPLSAGHAHNELLEATYEWGLAIPLTVIGLGWRLWPHLHTHDPWSAVVVVGAVLMCGTLAARVAPVGLLWWIACSIVAHN